MLRRQKRVTLRDRRAMLKGGRRAMLKGQGAMLKGQKGYALQVPHSIPSPSALSTSHAKARKLAFGCFQSPLNYHWSICRRSKK
jgi:hypothetical protein